MPKIIWSVTSIAIFLGCANMRPPTSSLFGEPIVDPGPNDVIRYANMPDRWLGQVIMACGVIVRTNPGEYVLYAGRNSFDGIFLESGLGETVENSSVQCVRGEIRRYDGRSYADVRRYGGASIVTHQPNPRVYLSGSFVRDPAAHTDIK